MDQCEGVSGVAALVFNAISISLAVVVTLWLAGGGGAIVEAGGDNAYR
jgi:hypothetical protein